MKSAVEKPKRQILKYRRAVLTHLVRQSGGPSPDPRDAIRLAATNYGLVPRRAEVGRFTARISRLSGGDWALDFNPSAQKAELVAAIWHELSELLCLSDDIVSFDGFNPECYRESAISAYDWRHQCAIGVERYVWQKLIHCPEISDRLRSDKIRHILLVRNATAPSEPILPSIVREPWFEDEIAADPSVFPL